VKKYLLVFGLSFACALVQAQTLKELRAEEKALRAEIKAIKEPMQVAKVKANIVRLRDELVKLQAKEQNK